MLKYNEYLASVQKVLSDLGGICPRCILRYGGVKSSREHRNVTIDEDIKLEDKSTDEKETECGPPECKVLKKDENSSVTSRNVKALSNGICIACLGVLQESFIEKIIDEVSNEIKSSEYDSNHFTIALGLPVSLALRNHSINLYLDERLENFDEEEVTPIKQVWKWLFPQKIAQNIGKKLLTGDFSEFYAELQFDFDGDEDELFCLRKMCEQEYANREKNHKKYHMGLVTRQGAEKSLHNVTSEHFKQHYPVPPKPLDTSLTCKVKMYHNSIYIAGRYNKYSRELPQTPWILDGVKIMPTSVEELMLEHIKNAFKFDAAKFSSSGREDVDVRTLGRGRPFMFEILNSRKVNFTQDELSKIQNNINTRSKDIRVRDLQVVKKDTIRALKDGEDTKKKTYTALCVIPKVKATDSVISKVRSLGDLEEIKLSQRTPIRVLHRRPNSVRARTVYNMKVDLDMENNEQLLSSKEFLFKLTLCTQAGTYVKEFVHGDFGRTSPNLCSILNCDVDIIALDVESIDLDWPPSLDT